MCTHTFYCILPTLCQPILAIGEVGGEYIDPLLDPVGAQQVTAEAPSTADEAAAAVKIQSLVRGFQTRQADNR